jgi:NADH:ubiquinone oxidoreductase subunit C
VKGNPASTRLRRCEDDEGHPQRRAFAFETRTTGGDGHEEDEDRESGVFQIDRSCVLMRLERYLETGKA